MSRCQHGKQTRYCRECGGSAFCQHGKIKSTCKECGGSAFCQHGKFKSTCKECGGSALCKNEWCYTTGNSKYEGYCVACFVNNPENRDKPAMRNYKTKEIATVTKVNFYFFTQLESFKGIVAFEGALAILDRLLCFQYY